MSGSEFGVGNGTAAFVPSPSIWPRLNYSIVLLNSLRLQRTIESKAGLPIELSMADMFQLIAYVF